MDNYDGNRKLDPEEFRVGMAEHGVHVTKPEISALLKYLDTDGDGNINFDEFLAGIRGRMNAHRQETTDRAFAKFDKDGNGYIDSDDLKGVYNCSHHPKVRSGEMTENDVFREFLAHFGDKNGDGKVSKAEWNDYYSAVSSNIDNDEHFIQLIKTAWKLD